MARTLPLPIEWLWKAVNSAESQKMIEKSLKKWGPRMRPVDWVDLSDRITMSMEAALGVQEQLKPTYVFLQGRMDPKEWLSLTGEIREKRLKELSGDVLESGLVGEKTDA